MLAQVTYRTINKNHEDLFFQESFDNDSNKSKQNFLG